MNLADLISPLIEPRRDPKACRPRAGSPSPAPPRDIGALHPIWSSSMPATPRPPRGGGGGGGPGRPAAPGGAGGGVTGWVEAKPADPGAYQRHQELVGSHPELYARSLVKQRRYADALTSRLQSWGATPSTARQAAEIGLACYYIGQATAQNDPRILARHVERALDRLRS